MAVADPRVGLTTTVPSEVLFAAGYRPLDLNNLFVGDPDPAGLVELAERSGFPASCCAWIKGLYGTVRRHALPRVVGVTEGDCSATGALLEILRGEGTEVIEFGFPRSRTCADLETALVRLAERLGTTLAEAEAVKTRLDQIRRQAARIDELAAGEGRPSSRELFDALLLLSDFAGDPAAAAKRLTQLENELAARPATTEAGRLRLACVGVPPILSDLWEVIENLGARVVFQEVPRQFALLPGLGKELAAAYGEHYTYPYDVAHRLTDIAAEIRRRRVAGVIHYVQSFCHRQLHDRLLRENLPVPILTLEADRPGRVDARLRLRLEAFVEQLTL